MQQSLAFAKFACLKVEITSCFISLFERDKLIASIVLFHVSSLQLPLHAEAECKVFTQKRVLPHFNKPFEYDFIKFLRTLLLRELDSKTWKHLCQLASHKEAREECEASVEATVASFKFITETCGLTQYDYDTVSHVVGIWGVNSFGANAPSGPNPTGRYDKKSY